MAVRPKDARLLIERGRLLAELRRDSEADLDFSHAAQLAPDNPQLFLNAGWWVAGPYPPDLKTPAPIESDPAPDPSSAPLLPATSLAAGRACPSALEVKLI